MIRYCVLALLVMALGACGQKGPLYMPDSSQGEVVTRPAAPDASNSPASPDSPGTTAPSQGSGKDESDKTTKKNGPTPPPK
jgi:predicted small lipoprotein YifL